MNLKCFKLQSGGWLLVLCILLCTHFVVELHCKKKIPFWQTFAHFSFQKIFFLKKKNNPDEWDISPPPRFHLFQELLTENNYQYLDNQPWCVAVNILTTRHHVLPDRPRQTEREPRLMRRFVGEGRASLPIQMLPTCGFRSQELTACAHYWANGSYVSGICPYIHRVDV